MTDPLFSCYPALAAEIDRLCRVPPWRMTGASALVCTADGLLFEIAKPRHWHVDSAGVTRIGLGAIGGSLNGEETLLECLQREALEELGTPLEVLSAGEAGFCADERTVSRLRLAPGGHPLPCLFTVGANRYRAGEIEAPTLAIATFWARPTAPIERRDLFGTLLLPWHRWAESLATLPVRLADLCAAPGVRITTQGPMPRDAMVYPVWTVHTLQRVLRAGGVPSPPVDAA